MSQTSPRMGQGGPGPESPPLAEQARTLVHAGGTGVLSTHSQRLVGFPFGSVMPYAPDAEGSPILLISHLAMHARNLQADQRASLLILPEGGDDHPLAESRVTLLGTVEGVPEAETPALRDAYLERNPEARTWVDFADFRFHRLTPLDVYFVAGFGVMGWVDPGSYRAAEPDPLIAAAPGMLRHMNEDHADALVLYCRRYAGVEAAEARMVGVDRLGFRVRARVGEEERDLRINFPREVRTPDETRVALVEMARAARADAGG